MAGGTRWRTSVALVVGLLLALGLSGFATAQNLLTRADYTTPSTSDPAGQAGQRGRIIDLKQDGAARRAIFCCQP
jgi:hypothetical protein